MILSSRRRIRMRNKLLRERSRAVFQPGIAAPLLKRTHRDRKRFAKPLAVATAVFFLFAAPALSARRPPRPPPSKFRTKPRPRLAQRNHRPKRTLFPACSIQTTKKRRLVSKIHQNMKSRMDAAVKDDKLSPEPRRVSAGVSANGARGSLINTVVTPDQKIEVRSACRSCVKMRRKRWRRKSAPPQG